MMTNKEINTKMEAYNAADYAFWRARDDRDHKRAVSLANEAASHARALRDGIDNSGAKKRWGGNLEMWLRHAAWHADKAAA